MKNAEFKVKVKADFSMSKAQLYHKVKGWMEHHAHTASSFGFELEEVAYLGRDDE